MSTAADVSPLRMVVLADSTAFVDADGPQLPHVEHLYPNVAARRLEAALSRPVEVTVLARAGMTVREAWRTLSKDRHAQFDVLAGADVVVVGVGSFDHAPGGLPPFLDALVPFVRPDGLRRRYRRALHAAYPLVVRATRGRLRRTTWSEFERLYELVLRQVAGLARGAAGVAVGPTSHRSAFYGHRHPDHEANCRRHAEVAARHGFPTVQAWPHVLPHVDGLNADGIHWPAAAHVAVGHAVADVLVAQLRGEAPRPHDPWAEVEAQLAAAPPDRPC